MLLQLFLISALLTFDSATSNLDCFLDQQECELHPDNHLDTVTGLSNMIECLEQCNGDTYQVQSLHLLGGRGDVPSLFVLPLLRAETLRELLNGLEPD